MWLSDSRLLFMRLLKFFPSLLSSSCHGKSSVINGIARGVTSWRVGKLLETRQWKAYTWSGHAFHLSGFTVSITDILHYSGQSWIRSEPCYWNMIRWAQYGVIQFQMCSLTIFIIAVVIKLYLRCNNICDHACFWKFKSSNIMIVSLRSNACNWTQCVLDFTYVRLDFSPERIHTYLLVFQTFQTSLKQFQTSFIPFQTLFQTEFLQACLWCKLSFGLHNFLHSLNIKPSAALLVQRPSGFPLLQASKISKV